MREPAEALYYRDMSVEDFVEGTKLQEKYIYEGLRKAGIPEK